MELEIEEYIKKFDEGYRTMAYDILTFREICRKGRIDIAKWIHSRKSIQTIDDEISLINACQNGNLEVVKWLYEINNNKISGYALFNGFMNASIFNHIDTVKWLYEKEKHRINIRIRNDQIMNVCCINQAMDVIEFLCTIYPGYQIEKVNNIITWKDNGQMNKLIEAYNTGNTDKYYVDAEDKNNDEMCSACLENKQEKWIKLNCTHVICLDCCIELQKCTYGCNNSINKIHFIKN